MRIVTVPHLNLRQPSLPVTQVDRRLRRLLTDLQATLQHSEIGVGLAAPQIGLNTRVFAVNLPQESNNKIPEYQCFINPSITKKSSKLSLSARPDGQPDLEGCLSIPRIYAPVRRPDEIDIEYDVLVAGQLQRQTRHLRGFAARVFQHEYDHLDGILFTDLALSQHQPLYYDQGDQLQEITEKDLIDLYGEY